MAAALVRLTSSRARGNLNVTSCLQRRPLVAVQKGRQAAVSMSSQSRRGFILKEVVHFGGLLGLSGMHHFPSKFTEYLQTPVGRLSNFEAHWLTPPHTTPGGPLCVPRDGLHTGRPSRSATFPEPSNSLRTAFRVSATLSWPLCELPWENTVL